MSNTVMFRLLDKRVDQNSHFLNEDGTKDESKKMDFTHRYGVLNPFFVVKNGKRIYYQYIQGCDFLDKARQDKEGWLPNINNSIVDFKGGADIVCDITTEDKVLAEFLKIHVNNVSSTNHNPDKHDRVFMTYDPKEELKKEVTLADKEDQALDVLFKLKTNKDRLLAVGNLFEQTSGLTDESEIYLRLREIAKEDPEKFINSIADRRKDVLGDILLAMKLNVIGKDAQGYFLVKNNTNIFEVSAKEKTGGELFADFLISKEGEAIYKEILIQKKMAEVRLEAPEGIFDKKDEEE